MDSEILKVRNTRRRELPPIPQTSSRGQRSLAPMPSEDTADEMPAPRGKKKKVRKEVETAEDPDNTGMEMGGLVSRRQSESREPLTPEVQDNLPQRRKKKKKAQSIDLDGDQADLVNGHTAEQNTDEEVPRKPKKKKVKPKVMDSQSVNELDVEDDDIITDAQPPNPIPQHSLFSAPQGQSQPVGKVFVEKSRRFQAAERVERRRTSEQTEQNFMDVQGTQWTTRDVAMKVHSGFRVIGLFSHGFLAGYSVWNIIVVYMLAGQQLSSLPNLLLQYQCLAYPAQSLLYLLLALSTVSAFDRVNLAKVSAAMRSLLTLEPVALASFLYFSALVLSLSQQMTSDRINLFTTTANSTLWLPGSENAILYPWVIVNLVVTILVGVAWVLVSTSPEVDYTQGFLMTMDVDYPEAKDKQDATA